MAAGKKHGREVQIYRETYDRKMTEIADEHLAAFDRIPGKDWAVENVQVLAAGVVLRGEQRLEYKDYRVYLRKTK
jgi:hypothetical protein